MKSASPPVLRVGQLWKTSGPPADATAISEWPRSDGAWGEGLVDRSLTSLWYPGDWGEVGDDELVFLLPTLTNWRSTAQGARSARSAQGPDGYLARTLKARALTTAARLCPHSATDPRHALKLLIARGILTGLPLDEMVNAGSGSGCGPSPAPCWPTTAPSVGPDETEPALPDWIAFELTAIAHLDRLLLDARGTTPANGATPASPLVDWPLSLADLVLATIHARFNGVYLHPQFAHAHELLTAAALLGHLVGGRAVYLPPSIAQSLADLLSGEERSAFGEDGWCAGIVRMHADLAGGAEYLRWLARRATASGRPMLAKPRPPLLPSDTGNTTWNARLLQRIALRWSVSA